MIEPIILGDKTHYALYWGLWKPQMHIDNLIARTETLTELKSIIMGLMLRKKMQGWDIQGLSQYVVQSAGLMDGKSYQRAIISHTARDKRPGEYAAGFWVLTPFQSQDKWLIVPLEVEHPVSHTRPILGRFRPVSYERMRGKPPQAETVTRYY